MYVPARLKPGIDEWSRFFYPTPTHENITTCVRKYSESKQAKDAIFLDGWTNPLNWINHFPEMFSNPSNENINTYLKWLSNEVSQIIAGNKFIIKELFE